MKSLATSMALACLMFVLFQSASISFALSNYSSGSSDMTWLVVVNNDLLMFEKLMLQLGDRQLAAVAKYMELACIVVAIAAIASFAAAQRFRLAYIPLILIVLIGAVVPLQFLVHQLLMNAFMPEIYENVFPRSIGFDGGTKFSVDMAASSIASITAFWLYVPAKVVLSLLSPARYLILVGAVLLLIWTIVSSLPRGIIKNRGTGKEETSPSAAEHMPKSDDSLDAVVIRIENNDVYMSAQIGGMPNTVRMDSELFEADALFEGAPVRIEVDERSNPTRLKVVRRQIEPVRSQEADELMAWVRGLDAKPIP